MSEGHPGGFYPVTILLVREQLHKKSCATATSSLIPLKRRTKKISAVRARTVKKKMNPPSFVRLKF